MNDLVDTTWQHKTLPHEFAHVIDFDEFTEVVTVELDGEDNVTEMPLSELEDSYHNLMLDEDDGY